MEEKEGINIDFYFILWEKYKDLYHSNIGVGLPHTVVYRNQYPIAWFFTNKQDQILKKRNVSLNNDAIFHHFTTNKKTKSDVLGYFIESDPEDNSTQITYFDEIKLKAFLDNPNQRPERGILQQFIDPVGENNALYRANWCERSCIVSKKVNRKNLFHTNLNIYERCCTFEGHHIFSDECTVAGGLLPGVIRKCMERMHLHIFALSHGNSHFKRADGFFKQDQTGKVWFLWNNCYRLQLKNFYGQKNYVANTFYSNKLNMRPLSLETDIKIPKYIEKGATYDQRRPNQLEKDLLCQNCDELHKHQNFAPISYKYLIYSRDQKNKEIQVLNNKYQNEQKIKKDTLNTTLEDGDDNFKQNNKTTGITASMARLNSHVLKNDEKDDIDDLIDQINNQRDKIDNNSKITIPEIFQKIHPKMTDYTYQQIKENPKFYSKQFWVCQNCYLSLISYNQIESGCTPQLNYKQIISSFYDFRPKPLRKELTKFQQECFDMFLDENRYQQAVWQNCTKTNCIEDYQKNKKRAFQDELNKQQLAEKKKREQQAIQERNQILKKNLNEEDKQMVRIQNLREKQKKIQNHLDLIINQTLQNSFSNRPSTSLTSLSKNNNTILLQNNPLTEKYIVKKGHKRSETNDATISQRLSMDEEETCNSQSQNAIIKQQSKQDEIQEESQMRSTSYEPYGPTLMKQNFNYLKEKNQNNNQENEHQNKSLNKNRNAHSVHQIQRNQVELFKLQSPKLSSGKFVLYQPRKNDKVKQFELKRNPSLNYDQNSYQIQDSKYNKTKLNQNDSQQQENVRPQSSFDRFNTKITIQDVNNLLRSKTPSNSFGNKTYYSNAQQSMSTNISSRQTPKNVSQQVGYLMSPKYSPQIPKEFQSGPISNRQSNSKNSTNLKIKKKQLQDLYLDNMGNNLTLNQNYLGVKTQDQTEIQENLDFQSVINHYASNADHQNNNQKYIQSQTNHLQKDDQEKQNLNLTNEMQEYIQNNEIQEKQVKQESLNNFQKIQFYPKQNVVVRNFLNKKQKSLSQHNFQMANQFIQNKQIFENKIAQNSNKTYKQQIIQDLFQKYSKNIKNTFKGKNAKQIMPKFQNNLLID
ncbi:hypothetical protein TTHERM_00037130 (macronuclear) [Tetrahymena thermophila SB210]|uniref:Uncharacterized protein n=1 Tax=Tetrahymena thermophila (strain SB210) TaxID=312017 RepID=Q22MA6_TETTS|nr:hypothetical protein TTHERM_00037130 [Tetrahymena thermophila SB210]EAR86612.2 hypothetical protein TTHERM_00037130 [Tetrahymena thermophila SB210]|eukprot:XP_977114.2 hypothetical protein TTHERM_00037130 [Tetrahymena thermophila SB210]